MFLYATGQKVKINNGLEGIITGTIIDSYNLSGIQYRIAWFVDGERYLEWLSYHEIDFSDVEPLYKLTFNPNSIESQS